MSSLAILAGIVAVVLAVYLIFGGSKASTSAARKPVERRPLRSYSLEEVKKHNSESSMWIIVKYGAESRVYDITEYCDMHPGGDVIYDSAGKDATEKFNGPQHPPTVHDLIREYHIGWLEGHGPVDSTEGGKKDA